MLSFGEVSLLFTTFILTIINISAFVFCIRQLSQRRRRYHPNYIALRFFHLFVCTFTSIVIAICGVILFRFRVSFYFDLNKEAYVFYKACTTVLTAGIVFMRCASIGLIVERLIATFLASTYETQHATMKIGTLVIAGSVVMGIVVSFLYHAKIYTFWVHVIVVTMFDFTNVLDLILLTRKNKQLRKLNTRSDIILSERYQLTENLKTLYHLRPVLIAQSIIMLLASSSGLFSTQYLYTRFYVDWIFYTMMNLSVSVMLSVTLLLKPIRSQLIKNQISQNGGVMNVFGRLLDAQQSPNEYFSTLRGQWS